MQLDPLSFDQTLDLFLTAWPEEKVKSMSIYDYADLKNHNSFCYWLEYGSKNLGEIGDNPLTKFELWIPKNEKEFKWNLYDGEFAWNPKKGDDAKRAFAHIKNDILKIIKAAKALDLSSLDEIKFHSIVKWKIDFLYSRKSLFPV
jgi:hypothetical protein